METNQHAQEAKWRLCEDAAGAEVLLQPNDDEDDGDGDDAFIISSCLKSFNLKHFKICWCGLHMSA